MKIGMNLLLWTGHVTEEHVPILKAIKATGFDGVEVPRALAFESALRQHVKSKFKDLFDRIESTKDMNADDEKALVAAIEDFKKNGAY